VSKAKWLDYIACYNIMMKWIQLLFQKTLVSSKMITYEISPKGVNASRNWCDSTSWLRSPINTWKCSTNAISAIVQLIFGKKVPCILSASQFHAVHIAMQLDEKKLWWAHSYMTLDCNHVQLVIKSMMQPQFNQNIQQHSLIYATGQNICMCLHTSYAV